MRALSNSLLGGFLGGPRVIKVAWVINFQKAGTFPLYAFYLGGSDARLEVPGLGAVVPPNLTPGKVLGKWTKQEVETAMRTGIRLGGGRPSANDAVVRLRGCQCHCRFSRKAFLTQGQMRAPDVSHPAGRTCRPAGQ